MTPIKEIQEYINEKIIYIHGLKELILLECPYSPEGCTHSVQSPSKSQRYFFTEIGKMILKIHVESSKTPNSQSNLEKQQS